MNKSGFMVVLLVSLVSFGTIRQREAQETYYWPVDSGGVQAVTCKALFYDSGGLDSNIVAVTPVP